MGLLVFFKGPPCFSYAYGESNPEHSPIKQESLYMLVKIGVRIMLCHKQVKMTRVFFSLRTFLIISFNHTITLQVLPIAAIL